MRTLETTLIVLSATLLLTACGTNNEEPDEDMAQTSDMSVVEDMGDADTDMDAPDMDAPDMTAPQDMGADMQVDMDADMPRGEDMAMAPDMPLVATFGTVSGMCGEIDQMDLMDPNPQLVRNVYDFADDAYNESDEMRLFMGTQRIVNTENAGGASIYSEAFAFEVLAQCEMAVLLKTENEVVYKDAMGKITDFLVEIDQLKVGVSVTRAYRGPNVMELSAAEAIGQLRDKLEDIQVSSARVSDEDRWEKQILHIMAVNQSFADAFAGAWDMLDGDTKADTILVITQTDGLDDVIYSNTPAP